jgi:hypothetical protein
MSTESPGAYARVDDPRVLVARERDPLTGRLTSAGDDRPGKRRRSNERAKPRSRVSRMVVIAGVVVGVLAVAGVAFAVSSGGDDTQAADPSTTTPSTPASRDSASASAIALNQLEGTWRFDVESPRVNFVAGRYKGAPVSISTNGNRIVVEARIDENNFHRTAFTPMLAGERTVTCSADSCGSGLTGFVSEGDVIRVVDRATLAPDKAGAGLCGAPAVANAGVVRGAGASSFRFVSGETSQAGSDCFQVVWTLVATKVS